MYNIKNNLIENTNNVRRWLCNTLQGVDYRLGPTKVTRQEDQPDDATEINSIDNNPTTNAIQSARADGPEIEVVPVLQEEHSPKKNDWDRIGTNMAPYFGDPYSGDHPAHLRGVPPPVFSQHKTSSEQNRPPTESTELSSIRAQLKMEHAEAIHAIINAFLQPDSEVFPHEAAQQLDEIFVSNLVRKVAEDETADRNRIVEAFIGQFFIVVIGITKRIGPDSPDQTAIIQVVERLKQQPEHDVHETSGGWQQLEIMGNVLLKMLESGDYDEIEYLNLHAFATRINGDARLLEEHIEKSYVLENNDSES
ncbi:hypothetical protein B0O99DRAFT_587984 [Bisporella sp. PMI_857]|nr:hypothetical protein B0O99DRAFT_587984 [Bisporella sp. PMI_857]